jgi:hypothetical protein
LEADDGLCVDARSGQFHDNGLAEAVSDGRCPGTVKERASYSTSRIEIAQESLFDAESRNRMGLYPPGVAS